MGNQKKEKKKKPTRKEGMLLCLLSNSAAELRAHLQAFHLGKAFVVGAQDGFEAAGLLQQLGHGPQVLWHLFTKHTQTKERKKRERKKTFKGQQHNQLHVVVAHLQKKN